MCVMLMCVSLKHKWLLELLWSRTGIDGFPKEGCCGSNRSCNGLIWCGQLDKLIYSIVVKLRTTRMCTYRLLGFIFCSAKLISIIFAFTVATLQSEFELHSFFFRPHIKYFFSKTAEGKWMKWERKEMRVDVEWNGQIRVTLHLFTFLFSKPFWFTFQIPPFSPLPVSKDAGNETHTSFTPCSLQFIFLNLKHSSISP